MEKYITPDIRCGRLRLLFRWARFGLKSLIKGEYKFTLNAVAASCVLLSRSIQDFFHKGKMCPICGWQGAEFYPNVGPGYYEHNTTCPRCLCQDRHRSLTRVLETRTQAFSPDTIVIEVAPMRSFQQFCLHQKANSNYLSFDYERYAMEQGDITRMRFEGNSCDIFICMHVLEHIENEQKALQEIHRVLKPDGLLVIQVPVDKNLLATVEYGKPNPRETNHVRRYGLDFPDRLKAFKFETEPVHAVHGLSQSEIEIAGYSLEPIYLARKTN